MCCTWWRTAACRLRPGWRRESVPRWFGPRYGPVPEIDVPRILSQMAVFSSTDSPTAAWTNSAEASPYRLGWPNCRWTAWINSGACRAFFSQRDRFADGQRIFRGWFNGIGLKLFGQLIQRTFVVIFVLGLSMASSTLQQAPQSRSNFDKPYQSHSLVARGITAGNSFKNLLIRSAFLLQLLLQRFPKQEFSPVLGRCRRPISVLHRAGQGPRPVRLSPT